MSINFTALMLVDDSMLHDNSKLIVSIIKDYPASNDEALFIIFNVSARQVLCENLSFK